MATLVDLLLVVILIGALLYLLQIIPMDARVKQVGYIVVIALDVAVVLLVLMWVVEILLGHVGLPTRW